MKPQGKDARPCRLQRDDLCLHPRRQGDRLQRSRGGGGSGALNLTPMTLWIILPAPAFARVGAGTPGTTNPPDGGSSLAPAPPHPNGWGPRSSPPLLLTPGSLPDLKRVNEGNRGAGFHSVSRNADDRRAGGGRCA